MLLRLLIPAFFGAVSDQVGDIVGVVPVIFLCYVLPVHVGAIDVHGIEKDLSGALVVADAIKDVSGHVDHVSGIWSERSEALGAWDCQFGMAAFHGVDPVVVGGGVVGMLLQDLAQYRLPIKGTGARFALG